MSLENEELIQLVERNAAILYALLEYLKNKEVVVGAEFIELCSQMEYARILKETSRDEAATRSKEDNMHAGGPNATIELGMMAELKADDYVLDAGTGHGGAARIVAETFRCHVVGLEMDYTRLINAIFRTKQAMLDDKVSFSLGDAYKMSFMNETFDIILRQHAVYGQVEEHFVSECFRVLKFGGRIAFQGILKKAMSFHSSKTNMEDYTLAEYIDMLKLQGFSDITYEVEQSTKELAASFLYSDPFMYNLCKKSIIVGVKIVAYKKR